MADIRELINGFYKYKIENNKLVLLEKNKLESKL